MASSRLVGSFPKASSTSGNCWKTEKCATNNLCATSLHVARASWQKTGKLSKEYCKPISSHNDNLNHHFKSIEVGSKYGIRERKYFMNAAALESHESEPTAPFPKNILESIKDARSFTLHLLRPYATIATVLGVLSSSLVAVENLSDLSPTFFIGLSQYTTVSLCMLVFQLALNDLVDIEIDKINKPHHPLASGQYSQKLAAIVAASCLFMCAGIGWFVGSWPMRWGLLAAFVLGSAYCVNLPWLRWKRFPPLAMVYIVVQPLISNNLAPFLHIQTHVFRRAAIYSRSIIFTLVINIVYNIVVAIFKDIPDIEGDKAAGIHSLASRIGPHRAFWLCISILEMAYGATILVGLTYPSLWSKILMVSAHSIIALVVWYNAKSVNVNSKAAVHSFYMIIFKLISIESIVIALAR